MNIPEKFVLSGFTHNSVQKFEENFGTKKKCFLKSYINFKFFSGIF